MSMVRFAMLCDACGRRSPEYTPWWFCTECMDDVCDLCCQPDVNAEESLRTTCNRCQAVGVEQ